MSQRDLVDEIAEIIFTNHEEQCCTCGEWKNEYVDMRENFLKPARAILTFLREIKHVPL